MRTTSIARGAGLATACIVASALTACSADTHDESDAPASQSQAASATPRTSSVKDAGPITEADVVGVWNNHRDTELHQQIRFTADHQWHEDQHGTKDIYHGTWEMTGDRTVMLHDWEEELRFTPGDNREFTVVSFDHVLTKDEG